MGELPKGFAGLLMNQVAVHDLTAEAVLHKSKAAALQALLVDPIVNQYDGIEEMLDTMIAYQETLAGVSEIGVLGWTADRVRLQCPS